MKTKHRNSYHLMSVVEDGLEKQLDVEGVSLSHHREGCDLGICITAVKQVLDLEPVLREVHMSGN